MNTEDKPLLENKYTTLNHTKLPESNADNLIQPNLVSIFLKTIKNQQIKYMLCQVNEFFECDTANR